MMLTLTSAISKPAPQHRARHRSLNGRCNSFSTCTPSQPRRAVSNAHRLPLPALARLRLTRGDGERAAAGQRRQAGHKSRVLRDGWQRQDACECSTACHHAAWVVMHMPLLARWPQQRMQDLRGRGQPGCSTHPLPRWCQQPAERPQQPTPAGAAGLHSDWRTGAAGRSRRRRRCSCLCLPPWTG